MPRVLKGQGYSEERIGEILRDVARCLDVEGIYKSFCVTVGKKKANSS